ncbi:MAG: hypothetical protein QXO69_01805 [archaeon]
MQDYYAPYEEEGWKKRFEMTIPILLLILVLIVLAWKLGWLCSIPVIGDVACGGTVSNILVVGDDANIRASLDELKVGMPINYEVMTEADIKGLRDPNYLRKYDLVILTESAGGARSDLPALFRSYLSSYLANNGKMIMFGLAGATDPAEPSANGWIQRGIGPYIPVTCKTMICSEASIRTATADISALKPLDITNPMVQEFGMTIPVTGNTIEFADVNVDEGKPVLNLEVDYGPDNVRSYPALVDSTHGVSGKTIYFAYHPSRTPTIFKNAVKYALGK